MKKIIKKIISENEFLKNLKEYTLWKRRKFSENSPPYIKREIIKKYTPANSVFIESGTYKGEMILNLNKHFSFCYSLEPSKKYYDSSLKILKNIKNKSIINDSSENALEKTLKKILEQNNKNFVFYLDGHFMEKDSFKGSKETPIEIELSIIEKHFNNFDKFTIIVDDFRLFGERKDYPSKDFLINFSSKIKKKFTVEHDMFICY